MNFFRLFIYLSHLKISLHYFALSRGSWLQLQRYNCNNFKSNLQSLFLISRPFPHCIYS